MSGHAETLRFWARRADESQANDLNEAAAEMERLIKQVETLEIQKDAADQRANRLCAAVEALDKAFHLPMKDGWVSGFKSCLKKIKQCLDKSPDNYLDHCLRVRDNEIERLRIESKVYEQKFREFGRALRKAEAERDALRSLLRSARTAISNAVLVAPWCGGSEFLERIDAELGKEGV